MVEIKIHEVGLRDGLQIEKQTVPMEKKIEWVKNLLASGIDMIQIGSFVHPEKVPQMADTDKLFTYFSQPGNKPAGAVLSGLVLNEKGLERGYGLRSRYVLHGCVGQQHPQPEKHRQEH